MDCAFACTLPYIFHATGRQMNREDNSEEATTQRTRRVRRTTALAVVMSVAMLGFGYALVPLYDLFCEVTGLGGRIVAAAQEPAADANSGDNLVPARALSLRLDATVGSVGSFDFFPPATKMPITTGEYIDFNYTVINKTNRRIVGQAIPSVVPAEAKSYLKKLECFCFTEQVLEPGQRVELPVRVFIDKRLPLSVGEITLSYVYYDSSRAES